MAKRKIFRSVAMILLLAASYVHGFLPAVVERSFNQTVAHEPYTVDAAAARLHAGLFVTDLHADSLLWKRDLLRRSDVGHVDLPRLRQGNVGLQVFSATTKSPSGLNYDSNEAGAIAREPISVDTASGTVREEKTKVRLEAILRAHDADKWFFTTTVVIDEQRSIPHSHPVLTLNTRHLENDRRLLSTFLHEQIHWYLVSRGERTQAAIGELERIYEVVPVGAREGGRDTRSTYLHLLVNYLEYQAMKELIGDDDAAEVMQFWATDHYTWIYATVLKDEREIAGVIDKFKLDI